MSNLFFGLNIGRSALLANQAALDVAGHNLANVQTEGYSRQRAVLTSSLPVESIEHTFGSGVDMAQVERVQAAWVERQIDRMLAENAYDTTRKEGLDELQALLGEPSDTGVGATLTEFWNSWEALSAQPGDSGLRAQVVAQTENVATIFNQRVQSLEEAEDQFDQNVIDSLGTVNTLLEELADLNGAVAKAAATGRPANDILDQRDVLVREVAEKLGVDVESDDAYLNLRLPDGGPYLVKGIHAFEISYGANAAGYVDNFKVGVGPVTLTGGEVGATLSLRDEISPELRGDLYSWMVTISNAVNQLHTSGYDRDGNAGRNLFTWSGSWDAVYATESSGMKDLIASESLQAGSHQLKVVGVDGVSANANGTLAAGSTIQLHAPAWGAYTGPEEINLDYHLKVLTGNSADDNLDGMRVQVFRGDEAVGNVVTLSGIGGPAAAAVDLGTVDGLALTADFDLGAVARFDAGQRSDGYSTVGEIRLDGGPVATVDLNADSTVTFVGGSDYGYVSGGTLEVTFGESSFAGAGFTLYGDGVRLGLDEAIAEDVDQIAAADSDSAILNGEIGRRIGDLANQRIHERTHETPSFFLGRVVQELGARGQEAEVFVESSSSILSQLEAQKDSLSGVNMDEEMVLLIQYQRGFQAASRFLSTVDGLLEQLINGTAT